MEHIKTFWFRSDNLLRYRNVCTSVLVSLTLLPLSTYRGRGEIGGVNLPSQLERTIHHSFAPDMVDRVKGEGVHPPTLTRLGLFYHHDGMYARKWPLPLSVCTTLWFRQPFFVRLTRWKEVDSSGKKSSLFVYREGGGAHRFTLQRCRTPQFEVTVSCELCSLPLKQRRHGKTISGNPLELQIPRFPLPEKGMRFAHNYSERISALLFCLFPLYIFASL